MKNLIAIFLISMTASGLSAQSGYNLFDKADVDEKGWLWFDSEAKINKYVGQADNTTGSYNASGKIIQLVSTDYQIKVPDPQGFPGDSIKVSIVTTAGVDSVGASNVTVPVIDPKTGETKNEYVIGGPGAKKGAIVLTSSKPSKNNGGGLLIKLPPIVSYELYLSSEAKMFTYITLSAKEDARISEYDVVKGYGLFKPLHKSGGHTEWKIGEEKNSFTGLAVKADKVQYVLCRNSGSYPLYVHGIRIFTQKPTTSTSALKKDAFQLYHHGGSLVCSDESAEALVFDSTGKKVRSGKASGLNLTDLKSGVYTVKAKSNRGVETLKIVLP